MDAWELALKFDDFYVLRDPTTAEEYLRRWVGEAKGSELEPRIKFAEMLEAHWQGVLRWHKTRASNGLLEGLNSLIQAAKRRARGYRSARNYKTISTSLPANSTRAVNSRKQTRRRQRPTRSEQRRACLS